MDSTETRPAIVNGCSRRSHCNPQICLAYMLSLVSSGIVVHGFCLWYKHRNTVWLVLPCLGLILILIGSCLYRCGSTKLHRAKHGLARRNRNASKRGAIESQIFESQLSLNMLPQCFSNFDTYTSSSRILNSNATHRYLSLPIDSHPAEVQLQSVIMTNESETNRDKRYFSIFESKSLTLSLTIIFNTKKFSFKHIKPYC